MHGLAADTGLPADLLRTLGAIPSYYLHYFYCTDQAVRAQASGPQRAEEVLEIERTLLDMYADPALDRKPELLEKRGGAYYSEAAAALVTSLRTGDGGHHYVDVRNGGTIAGLPDEAVVEVPALVDTDGPHPVPVAPLAPEMLGLVQAVTAYEVLAIDASECIPASAKEGIGIHEVLEAEKALDVAGLVATAVEATRAETFAFPSANSS